MKLVVNMNLSPDWIPALQAAGIEAVHWATVGPRDASDEAIMLWAKSNDAVVLTRDLDFAAMLMFQGLSAPSVIQMRVEQARPDRHLALVQRVLASHGDALEQGAIFTLDDERVRVRTLSSPTEN